MLCSLSLVAPCLTVWPSKVKFDEIGSDLHLVKHHEILPKFYFNFFLGVFHVNIINFIHLLRVICVFLLLGGLNVAFELSGTFHYSHSHSEPFQKPLV